MSGEWPRIDGHAPGPWHPETALLEALAAWESAHLQAEERKP